MAPKTVLLRDIDGTLLRTFGIGRDVFDTAITAAWGIPPLDHGVRMGGKTDPEIAREILTVHGRPADTFEADMATVLAHLEHQVAAVESDLREVARTMPGVRELLPQLKQRDDVVQTLLTGNLKPNALIKLRSQDLETYVDWDVGAFGSDHEIRAELVPLAMHRVAQRGDEVDLDHTWVIGDALGDLVCARANGVRCLLVGTGGLPMEELASYEPDALLEDLSDTHLVLKTLGIG